MIKFLHTIHIAKCIPLAFDESLSYLEQLYAILHKLNELIGIVRTHSDLLEQLGDEIDTINTQIDSINEELKTYEESITSYVDNSIENMTTLLSESLSRTYNDMLSLVDNLTKITDIKLEKLAQELRKEIQDIQAGLINIYDPTTGLLSPIDTVIDNMWSKLRYEAITCEEYDSLELTAQEYDNKEITAQMFDLYGKSILIPNSVISWEYIYKPTVPLNITQTPLTIENLLDYDYLVFTYYGYSGLINSQIVKIIKGKYNFDLIAFGTAISRLDFDVFQLSYDTETNILKNPYNFSTNITYGSSVSSSATVRGGIYSNDNLISTTTKHLNLVSIAGIKL